MFTGLVQTTTKLLNVDKSKPTWRLKVENCLSDPQKGESIALNGICLTLSGFNDQELVFDVSVESQTVTSVGHWQQGDRINVERALRAGDPLGGHFVNGHIDSTVVVESINHHDACIELFVNGVEYENQRLLVPKGCVALDGISLTINQVTKQGFNVMIVPETLGATNLDSLAIGKSMNIEYDILAKMVDRQNLFWQKG